MLETSFRKHRDEVTRTLIGCPPTAERQKNRIRSYLLRNSGYGATPGGNGNGATDFFHVSNVILTEFRLHITATAKRQRQNGNRMLETRHNGLSD